MRNYLFINDNIFKSYLKVMANPRIAEYWKATQIKKWEVRNKTWQPKKGISLVNAELKEKWYTPATKADIEENYMSLLQLEEDQLKEMVNDKTKPMLIRILVKNMLWWKGFDIIEKMLDRWIGKAVQKSEVDLTQKTIISESDLTD